MTQEQAKSQAQSEGATFFLDMEFGGYIAAYRPAQSLDNIFGAMGKLEPDPKDPKSNNRREWARAILRPNGDGYTVGDWQFCATPEME